MEMPKPGDAHKKLRAFVGEWSGPETLYPAPWDPAGGKSVARVVNRWIVDGFAVMQEYEQRRGGKVAFRGHGVIWFDPARQEYVMNWWDSMGGAGGEYRGSFDGTILRLAASMPNGGHSRTSWDFAGPRAYSFNMEISSDGQTWHPAMVGNYARTAKKVRAKKAQKAARKVTARAPARKKKAKKR